MRLKIIKINIYLIIYIIYNKFYNKFFLKNLNNVP